MGLNIYPPRNEVAIEVPLYSDLSGGVEGLIAKTTEDGRFYMYSGLANRWEPILSYSGRFAKNVLGVLLGNSMSSYTKGIVIP